MTTDPPPQKQKLIDAVQVYKALLMRVDAYLKQDLKHPEIATYLKLSLTNYYTKRRGERRYTYEEVRLILERFGTQEELKQFREFIDVRDKVYDCLKESPVPLTEYRRLLSLQHHRDLAHRRDFPDTWRIEDLELIGHFMESVGYIG